MNHLESIPADLLQILPQLILLDLSNNHLANLSWEFLDGVSQLWRLDLRANNINQQAKDRILAFLRFRGIVSSQLLQF